MSFHHVYRITVLVLLLTPACSDHSPIKPLLPAEGVGLVFASIRDLYYPEVYSVRRDGSGLVRLTNDSLDDRQPRWSPDGKHIAYIHCYQSGGNKPNVTIMDAKGKTRHRLTDDAGDANPTWSPDGSKIAFERELALFPRNQLWIVNADGTSPTLVVDSLEARDISWTPLNTFIGIDGAGLVQFNADGTAMNRFLSLQPGTVSSCYPRMSPDGTKVVFQWGGAYGSDSQIYVVNADGTNLVQLTYSTGYKLYPTWSKDGSSIAFTSEDELWTMASDGSQQVQVGLSRGGDYLGDWR